MHKPCSPHTRPRPVVTRESRHEAQWPVTSEAGQGITRNLSASGLYLELDNTLEPGQTLSLTVELDVMGRKMQWQCQALVVRQDERSGKTGFGAKILEQCLVDLD